MTWWWWGVVNETHPQGVFNPASLQHVYALTEFAKTLQWTEKDGTTSGVVVSDMIAPSVVDNIEQGGMGEVRFSWLMPQPPETDAEALALREKVARLPFFNGTMVSEDGKALALYLPLTAKDQSYRVYRALQEKITEFKGEDQFFITGLPVANDTFGVEMFVQMAISAPLAMLVIFFADVAFFPQTDSDCFADASGVDGGDLDNGLVGGDGQHGTHHEFHDTDFYHADSGVGLDTHSLGIF